MNRACKGAAVLAAVVLAGCGPAQNRPDDGPDKGLRLAVPPTASSSSVDLVLEHVGVDPGTEVSLFAYRTDWDAGPPSCQGSAEPVGTTTISSDGRETVNASLTDGPGEYWWVVVAPGYTSECGAEGSATRVLAAPEIELAQQDPQRGFDDPPLSPEPAAGKPYPFSVTVSEPPPDGSPWQVEVAWYGPFESTPEAVSEGCGEDSPVATSTTVEATSTKTQAGEATPPEPGVYRVVAEIPASSHTQEVTSGCDDQSSLVVVE